MDPSEQLRWKKEAAEAAAALIQDGMVLGLGTGSTAALFLRALGRRISEEPLRISGIPTSDETAALARGLKIPLTDFSEHVQIDLTVDGADEVEQSTLFLIKGHGGALLREKIVAAASKRMIVVADQTKLSERLGSLVSVPVEVVPFGWETTQLRLGELGGKPSLRLGKDGKRFITDSGHYIIDCAFGPMENPKEIAHHLDHVVGSVEHGMFLKFATEVFIGGPSGVSILRKTAG
ncbi:MAG TPA: ribose-5-phosphate isomerase RpiA [Candidatus Acidoferrales bacterium]